VNLGSVDSNILPRRLRQSEGLPVRLGPFVARITSSLDHVHEGLRLLYTDFPLAEESEFTDFHVRIAPPKSVRRFLRRQVLFYFDGRVPFKPLPIDQAFPLLEWGLNWCVSSHAHQYLVVHAAVVAKDGKAAIMAAPPGSGKSTLCAGLVNRGWRLLSDELALVCRTTGTLMPIPRPVSLKNESIGVIRAFAPNSFIGRASQDTSKGTVAHMRPPTESVTLAETPATPSWLLFPKFDPGGEARIQPLSKGRAFMQAAENSFNYSVLGVEGFRAMGGLVDACECYSLNYGDLDEAVTIFGAL
jgi:HprK-related kinase A